MKLAKRLQKLETNRCLLAKPEVLRIVVTSVGGPEDMVPTCSRSRCPNGMIMELVKFGSRDVPEGEALEQWIAGFPIEAAGPRPHGFGKGW